MPSPWQQHLPQALRNVHMLAQGAGIARITSLPTVKPDKGTGRGRREGGRCDGSPWLNLQANIRQFGLNAQSLVLTSHITD